MLGLGTFGNVGVTRMTTSRRIWAAVNENDEYLCNMYFLDIISSLGSGGGNTLTRG